MTRMLSQHSAHPDATTDIAELRAHLELFALGVSTPGRKKDPEQQELIDALLPGKGLSIQSGCVDQGEERCQPRSPSPPGRSTSA